MVHSEKDVHLRNLTVIKNSWYSGKSRWMVNLPINCSSSPACRKYLQKCSEYPSFMSVVVVWDMGVKCIRSKAKGGWNTCRCRCFVAGTFFWHEEGNAIAYKQTSLCVGVSGKANSWCRITARYRISIVGISHTRHLNRFKAYYHGSTTCRQFMVWTHIPSFARLNFPYRVSFTTVPMRIRATTRQDRKLSWINQLQAIHGMDAHPLAWFFLPSFIHHSSLMNHRGYTNQGYHASGHAIMNIFPQQRT